MRKFIKIFAVWVLLFALPLQGIAATTLMNCEISHSHENMSLAEIGNHDGHGEAINHQTTHAPLEYAADNHDSHHSSSTKHNCNNCGTCTVCCATSAIVETSTNVAAQFDNSKVNLTYTSPLFTSFVSAGIERPPRFNLV